MPIPPRSRALATAVLLTSVSVCAAACSSPASAPLTPAARPAPSASAWRPPQPVGMSGPISDVLASAPASGPVRIVTLVDDTAGRPQVRVTVAADRAQADAVVTAARSTPGAVAVTVDHRVATTAVTATPAPSNDTYRSAQWALDRLQAEAVWAAHRADGQTVAVVDTGVDGTHPDLAGAVLPGVDYVTATGDGRTDPNGHGTHVAGIIAALAGNGVGVAGLAAGAKILPVRVLDQTGSGWTSDVARGVTYAADHGAKVVNMSLSGTVDDPTLAAAIRYAQSKDVLVVAAAGNSRQNGDPVDYPAADAGVLAVAATDSSDASAPFSETGSFVTLAAPGVQIASTYPRCGWNGTASVCASAPQYVYMSGTSMASPYAAAAAALVRAAYPTMSATDVYARLVATAQDLGAAGRDNEFGAGLINPLAAVTTTPTGSPNPSASLSPSASPTPDATPSQAPTSASPSPTTSPSASPSPSAAPTVSPSPSPEATSTSLSVSSAAVTSGDTVRITVAVRTARNTPVSGAAQLCTRRLSATSPTCGGLTIVNGTGGAVLNPQVSTDVYVRYPGGNTTLASTSNLVRVSAAPVVRAAGGYRMLLAFVTPAQGQQVAIQQYVSGAWKTAAAHIVTSGSLWTVGGLTAGTYRLQVPGTAELQPVTSATLRVY